MTEFFNLFLFTHLNYSIINMAHILIMPAQGNAVESCIIQEWMAKEGDIVKADTILCIVETDKASFEIPAGADGILLKLLYQAGEEAPVMEPIAIIGKAEEDWKTALGKPLEKSPGKSLEKVSSEKISSEKVLNKNALIQSGLYSSPPGSETMVEIPGKIAISPRARNLAAKKGISTELAPGSGPGGRVIESDIQAILARRPPLTASVLSAINAGQAAPSSGSGLGGRVTMADLEAKGKINEKPIRGIRKIIAERMTVSLLESAQFTIHANASAVKLLELKKQFSGGNFDNYIQTKITINDLVLYVLSRVLLSFPYMNAHKIGDTIKIHEHVHLGMAVDTERGLMVPIIKNADTLSLRQISGEANRLAAACRDGKIKPEELAGSTFSVSNLGSYGISFFTPVLNLPEAAILGICGIEIKTIMKNEDLFINEPHIGFSLTINHQIIDGAPAARFLNAFCRAIADIDLPFVQEK